MIPNLFETVKFAQDYGVFALIIICFAIVGIYISVRFFLGLHSDIRDVTEITKQLGDKIGHKDGDPLIHFQMLSQLGGEIKELRQDSEEHNERASKHYIVTEEALNTEVWTRCPMDKCPNMGKMFLILQSLVERLDQFDKKAQESRIATGATLEGINAQMHSQGQEIGNMSRQMIDAMRDIVLGRRSK